MRAPLRKRVVCLSCVALPVAWREPVHTPHRSPVPSRPLTRPPCAWRTHPTRVCVAQGCHLDVGFAATAPEIVNRWFDIFFPLAYRIGKQLDQMQSDHDPALNGTNARLRFTAQSWLVGAPRRRCCACSTRSTPHTLGPRTCAGLCGGDQISMYIDCPADWEGIHCPNATALAQFHEAVARGWITW